MDSAEAWLRKIPVLMVVSLVGMLYLDFVLFQTPSSSSSVPDWIFSQSLPWAIFFAVMLGIVLIRNIRVSSTFRVRFLTCLIGFVALSFLIEPTRLAHVLCWPLLLALSLAAPRKVPIPVYHVISSTLSAALMFPFRPFRDFLAVKRWRRKHGKGESRVSQTIAAWRRPVLVSSVFLGLFAMSNPIFESCFNRALEYLRACSFPSIGRLTAVALFGSFLWTVLRPARNVAFLAGREPWRIIRADVAFVTRSLLLLNLLFAVNNVFDFEYLWAEVKLPLGLTYAEYAHQGAYSLVVTTALAAFFIVWAFGENQPTRESRLARRLMYTWVVQNLFLLCSTLLRLARYVEEYSLSELRLYVMIWCVVVCLGFLSLIWRLRVAKSNEWLIGVNTSMALITLTLCCYLNFNGVIAWYNVLHCRQVQGGPQLDSDYLLSLGAEALPAVRWFSEQTHSTVYRSVFTANPYSQYQNRPGGAVSRFSSSYLENLVTDETIGWRFNSLRRAWIRMGEHTKPEGLRGWIGVLLF